MSQHKMPVLFVSHGSPMLALDKENGQEFNDWGNKLGKPKAILVFSAHWETSSLAFGKTQDHNELIYDFSGFPKSLYEVQYPAPGVSDLVESIINLIGNSHKLSQTDRGLDHGVWVPFLHMWPEADVPILQMTLPYNFSNQALYELGQMLAPLRKQGIMITGNGTLTHNLREWNPLHNNTPTDWALAFDEWAKKSLLDNDIDALLNWEIMAPQSQRNHPTPEHFRPLLITLGAALGDSMTFPIEGFEYSIFSERSVQFG